MKQFLRDYFTFNKRERRGIVFLIVIILLEIIAIQLIPVFRKPDVYDFSHFENEVAGWENAKPLFEERSDTIPYYSRKYEKRKYDNFDSFPKNYWSKNDSSYYKTDLRFKTRSKPKEKLIIDLNSADSIEFLNLGGVGPWYCHSILSYRAKLGGFISTGQLREIKKLPKSLADSIIKYVVIDPSQVKKINLNRCLLTDLRNHPYFNYNLANAIVNYRQMHGTFASLSDLKKIHLVNDSIYGKIAPYLFIEP